MPCRTVLVIPCYNEATRLRPERFRAFLSALPEMSLLFVDDGSTDGTAEALGGFEVLRLARNRGKGEAVRQGVLHCLSSGRAPDYIGFLDADLAVDPCEAARLTEALEEEPAAWMACASRWRRLGAEIRRKPLRAALGRLMAALQLILGDFFARRLLVGFPELVDAVDAMASGDFSRRVRSLGPDEELTRLADAVNQMAANTEGLLAELKAVTDNVAHDLRTPITRLRARAELAMRTGRTAKLPGEVAEECDGLLRFIATALCVSRLSHGLDVGESVEADAGGLRRGGHRARHRGGGAGARLRPFLDGRAGEGLRPGPVVGQGRGDGLGRGGGGGLRAGRGERLHAAPAAVGARQDCQSVILGTSGRKRRAVSWAAFSGKESPMRRKCLLFLVLPALALLAARVAAAAWMPVFDPSEARYATLAANMARSGDFVRPAFFHHGVYQTFAGKPPLSFQMGALACRAFGVGDFAVRLPSLLCAAGDPSRCGAYSTASRAGSPAGTCGGWAGCALASPRRGSR